MCNKREGGGEADICLILEGSYPFVSGGVSTWTHKLIESLKDFSFRLLSVLPPGFEPEYKYKLPSNVVGVDIHFLQKFPREKFYIPREKRRAFFAKIEAPLLNMQYSAKLSQLRIIIEAFRACGGGLSDKILLNSKEAWRMLLRMYRASVGGGSFLNYFWSWRNLLGNFYSVIALDLPPAKIYHSLCTGYAGLLLARVKLELGRPCILTEHGIYANERRIEIIAADWLEEQKSQDLNIFRPSWERDIKDYWVDTFIGYSKMTYAASDQIITLYEGNRASELEDGADPERIKIVPNGIDVDYFAKLKRGRKKKPLTIALIGRVVPIKDIKTFINAVPYLINGFPELRCWVIGSKDEDLPYYLECEGLVKKRGLEGAIQFLGRVSIADYLPEIDILVLTSISEAQPLVILEAGAAGIPCVATDVGSCRELIFGRSDERPNLGPGGEICPLSSPKEIANSVRRLLINRDYYDKCSSALQKRVKKYYVIEDVNREYRDMYKKYMGG